MFNINTNRYPLIVDSDHDRRYRPQGVLHAGNSTDPPPESRTESRPGALAALAAASISALVVLTTRALEVWRGGIHTIDHAMELTIEIGAAACAAWLAVGALVALTYTAATRAGRTWACGHAFLTRHAPQIVRRLAGVAITASIGVGIATPGAFAVPTSAEPGADDRPPAGVVLDLGWRPTAGAGHEAAGHDVTVRRGDTLWSIAGAHLARVQRNNPHVTPARIAREVTAWHTANRSTIGPDPDLITPGIVLHPPAAHTEGAPL